MREKKYLFILLCVGWLFMLPTKAQAQEYSVSYKEQRIEQIISDLREKTGYEFMYQKQIVENVPLVTFSGKKLPLVELLDQIFWDKVGLNYEIVQKTIVLSKKKERAVNGKRTITGSVTDEKGEPLAGVNILLENSTWGAVTDMDGKFTLQVDGENPIIRITYIGMKEQHIRVNAHKSDFFAIRMLSDAKIMDEVLVTGYQNLKRENATGAYQMVSSKDMGNRYSGTIVSNLEGKIPGLVSYNNGLSENGEASLLIRGVGSFQAKTNPLVVVDGLPIEGSIESVNPYEIENITVLKDASAASIYGARASNGVIVITTKRAHEEKLTVDFSADLTIHEKVSYDNFQWANAAEMIELEKYNFYGMRNDEDQVAFNSIVNYYHQRPSILSRISRLLIENHLGELSDQALNSQLERMSKYDYRKEWQDAMERNQVLQQYNLSLRTKGKVLNSSIVANFKQDNNGIVNEKNQTLTFSYRGDLKANNWLNFSFGTNIINERAKTHLSDGMNGINSFNPYRTMFNEDGTRAAMEAGVLLDEESLKNPAFGFKSVTYNLLDETDMNFRNTHRTNIRSFVHANANILPEWRVGAQYQYEDITYKSDAFYEADSYKMRSMYNSYTAVNERGQVVH